MPSPGDSRRVRRFGNFPGGKRDMTTPAAYISFVAHGLGSLPWLADDDSPYLKQQEDISREDTSLWALSRKRAFKEEREARDVPGRRWVKWHRVKTWKKRWVWGSS